VYEKVSTDVTRRAGSSAAAETRSFLALRMACDATHPQSASRRYADRAAALTLQIYLDASRGHRLHGRPGHLQPPCWQIAGRRVFRDHDSPCAASISSGLGRRIVTYNAQTASDDQHCRTTSVRDRNGPTANYRNGNVPISEMEPTGP